MRASICISFVLVAALALACQNSPARTGPAPEQVDVAASEFSGDAAFAHLRALAALGPRVAGTPGAEAARAYIRGEIEKLGLQVGERRITGAVAADGTPLTFVNLVTAIPGESEQRFVLIAPYDTRRFDTFRFQGANDGASAPALLLELARVIQAHPLHYTTWIAFLDAEAPVEPGADAAPALLGSRALADELLSEAATAPVRLVVAFQQVGDADLHIARDLRSHRLFREEFWLAAARLGRSDAFRPDDPFASPSGSHLPFLDAGFRGVVLLTDPSYGGDMPPGTFANSEADTPDHCSAQSLASVGSVTIEALDRIAERLAKIDRFSTPAAKSPAPSNETPAQTPTPVPPPTAKPPEP